MRAYFEPPRPRGGAITRADAWTAFLTILFGRPAKVVSRLRCRLALSVRRFARSSRGRRPLPHAASASRLIVTREIARHRPS